MRFIFKQLFSLVLPFTALVVVPYIFESNFAIAIDIVSIAGTILAVAGLTFLVLTIIMFIRIGRGTLAPWSPTRKLVVGGLYAYCRNPMITGVLITLLGESLFFHSIRIYIWFISFYIINNIYFVLSEEPGLEKRFGEEYLEYKQNVPRWVPRLKPWKPDNKS